MAPPMLRAPELRALADQPERFATELWRWHPTAMLPKVVDLLRASPALLDAVKARGNSYQLGMLALWLPRTIHPDGPGLRPFLELANRLAQRHWPGHPMLDESILGERRGGNWGAWSQSGDALEQGVGWSLSLAVEIGGPANEAEEHAWVAVAHGMSARLEVHREYGDQSPADALVWSELISH